MSKTPMQELIEWAKQNREFGKIDAHKLISKATELLDKEKEQIKRANDDGWSDGRREKFNKEKFFIDSEEYYTKTYNQ